MQELDPTGNLVLVQILVIALIGMIWKAMYMLRTDGKELGPVQIRGIALKTQDLLSNVKVVLHANKP